MTSIQYITVNPLPKDKIESNSSKPSYYTATKSSNNSSSNHNNIKSVSKFNSNSGSSSDNEYSCSGHSTSSGHEFEIQGCRDGRAQVQRVLNKSRRRRFQRNFNDRSHRKLSNVSSCNSSSQFYASASKLPSSSSKLSQRKFSSSYESLNSDHSRETCNSSNNSNSNCINQDRTQNAQHNYFSTHQKKYVPKNDLRYYSYQNQNYNTFSNNSSNSGRISHNSYDSGINTATHNTHNSLSKNFEFCHKYQKESIKKFVQDSHQFSKNAKYMVDYSNNVNNYDNPRSKPMTSQAEQISNSVKPSSDDQNQNEVGNYLWNSLMQIFSLSGGSEPKTQTQVYSVKKVENLRSRLESNLTIPNPSYGESQGNELWMADWRN